ncbi:hypothetical protein P5641_11750 [Bacillus subtilis]|uniref:Uncharacterized protein n=1 Tax=Bacillus subtilis TaxID=1423 RepID=A0AC61Z4J8_BACIU|nr:hypothetical protein [Bacillus subtilis]OTQ85470.1 hypothetical protein BG30_10505 [Bacillus subtilis subsp. subtilis]MED3602948.1 hypothetical protein [Bacillus subtilis]MED3628497.1 hypothetical protein [Bacillus subtilis]MED3693452.1 hypothetical protein [Bacillus subtilis]
MSENKLLFFFFSFSSIVRLLFNAILNPTSSWKAWSVNIALILIALLFLKLTLKEKKETQQIK